MSAPRLCVICFARVTNQNPLTVTCGPDCTAKHRGKKVPEPQFRHCPVCQSPVADDASRCGSCDNSLCEDDE